MDENGKRKLYSVRLGPIPQRKAEEIRGRVEVLNLAASGDCTWDPQTAAWVAKLTPALHEKLAAVSFVPPRVKAETATLGPFLRAYIDRRSQASPPVKASTVDIYRHVERAFSGSLRR